MTNERAKLLLYWYDQQHRDLPWRRSPNPYHIWISEIMLQQTRVETVIGYYEHFLSQFPTVEALALAPEDAVLKAWEGLGYYSRARNLQRAAQILHQKHQGQLPSATKELRQLPGIGEYTAGAIASIAFDQPAPAVDGNVERVISRLQGIREDIGIPSIRRQIRAIAQDLLPARRPGDFNQALMELGACVCTPTNPKCDHCPLQSHCDAHDAGDAAELPHKQKPGPKKIEERSVILLLADGHIFVQKRSQALLKGLWEFPSFTGLSIPEITSNLSNTGIPATFAEHAGQARHVFTHLVWNMEILVFHGKTPANSPAEENSAWVNAQALGQLPFPTALKAAREAALQRLEVSN